LREKGWRVYYQPQSTIIHFESASYGKDVATGAKSYQLNNRAKFVERWAKVLKQQPAPPLRLDYATLCVLAVRTPTGEASANAD